MILYRQKSYDISVVSGNLVDYHFQEDSFATLNFQIIDLVVFAQRMSGSGSVKLCKVKPQSLGVSRRLQQVQSR